jgi:hypothetical protein
MTDAEIKTEFAKNNKLLTDVIHKTERLYNTSAKISDIEAINSRIAAIQSNMDEVKKIVEFFQKLEIDSNSLNELLSTKPIMFRILDELEKTRNKFNSP